VSELPRLVRTSFRGSLRRARGSGSASCRAAPRFSRRRADVRKGRRPSDRRWVPPPSPLPEWFQCDPVPRRRHIPKRTTRSARARRRRGHRCFEPHQSSSSATTGARAAYVVATLQPERVRVPIILSVGYGTNDPSQQLFSRRPERTGINGTSAWNAAERRWKRTSAGCAVSSRRLGRWAGASTTRSSRRWHAPSKTRTLSRSGSTRTGTAGATPPAIRRPDP
jgi:hypothetical protein